MTSDFEEFSIPDVIHYIWYDAVLDGGMNPGRPALEASTLPLGYREGGQNHDNHDHHVIVKYNSKLC